MCGISGALGPQATRSIVERMTQALAHRGPDDRGVEAGPGWALGNTRLAIRDLSAAGHQPMASADGRYVLVYNGELYNSRALRAELETRHGWRFCGHSDTEVLLALIAVHGQAALQHLEGMYAFVVRDALTGTAWGARDPLGIKPLYYLEANGTLYFASEVQAMDAALGPLALSTEALLGYLQAGFVVSPGTVLSGVQALLPGHILGWDGRGCRTGRAPEPIASLLPVEDPAEIRTALETIVEAHMESDVPLGAFLSGGIDSGIAVGLMAERCADRIATFTLGFDVGGGRLNEGDQAAQWARHWNTSHHHRTISGNDLAGQLDVFFSRLDQPSCDGINTFCVSRFAAEHVTVAISGLGADEVFFGYHTHRFALAWNQVGLGLAPVARALSPILERLPSWVQEHWLVRVGRAAGARTWPERYGLLRQWPSAPDARNLLAPQIRAGGPADPLLERLLPLVGDDRHPVEQVARIERDLYLADQLLRDSDALSMACGLELRVPFLDGRLLRLARRIPVHLQFTPNEGKRLLRRAFADWPLPPASRKRGFTFPLAPWARSNARVRQWLQNCLSRDRLARRGLLDATVIGSLLDRFLAAGESEARALFPALWRIASYEAWCEGHGR